MTRKSIKGIYTRSMQEKATDPIIENDKLPKMDDDAGSAGASKKGKLNLMDKTKSKAVAPSKKAVSEGKLMAAFTKTKQKEKKSEDYGDQVARSTRSLDRGSYLVFRMHIQNGVISVKGCKRVDSSLAQFDDVLSGGLTYEVMLNSSRLNLASIPDFGEQRSFPRPPGEKGQQGHHITVLPGFDFNVRIPADKIAEKDLPKIKVSLYRFKEHVHPLKLNDLPLSQQFEKEARLVATLDGIKTSALPKEVKLLVKKAFVK